MSKEMDELNDFINDHFSKLNAEIEKRINAGKLVPGPINPYTGEVSARWCLENIGPFNPEPDTYSIK